MQKYEDLFGILMESSAKDRFHLSLPMLRTQIQRVERVWHYQSRIPEFLIEFVTELAQSPRRSLLYALMRGKVTTERFIEEMLGIEHSIRIAKPTIQFSNNKFNSGLHRRITFALCDLRGLRALCEFYLHAAAHHNSQSLNNFRDAVIAQLQLLEQWFTEPIIAQNLNFIWTSANRIGSRSSEPSTRNSPVDATKVIRLISRTYRLGDRAAREIQVVGAIQQSLKTHLNNDAPLSLSEVWHSLQQVVTGVTQSQLGIGKVTATIPKAIHWQVKINAAAVLLACTDDFTCCDQNALRHLLILSRSALSFQGGTPSEQESAA